MRLHLISTSQLLISSLLSSLFSITTQPGLLQLSLTFGSLVASLLSHGDRGSNNSFSPNHFVSKLTSFCTQSCPTRSRRALTRGKSPSLPATRDRVISLLWSILGFVLGLAVRPSKLSRHHRAENARVPLLRGAAATRCDGSLQYEPDWILWISIQPRKSAAAESPRSHRVGLLLAGVSIAISAVKTTKNPVLGSAI